MGTHAVSVTVLYPVSLFFLVFLFGEVATVIFITDEWSSKNVESRLEKSFSHLYFKKQIYFIMRSHALLKSAHQFLLTSSVNVQTSVYDTFNEMDTVLLKKKLCFTCFLMW